MKHRKNILLCYEFEGISPLNFTSVRALWIHSGSMVSSSGRLSWANTRAAPHNNIQFPDIKRMKLFCCFAEDWRRAHERKSAEKIRNYDHDFELAFSFILPLALTSEHISFIHFTYLLFFLSRFNSSLCLPIDIVVSPPPPPSSTLCEVDDDG